jgi:hypothetical protein
METHVPRAGLQERHPMLQAPSNEIAAHEAIGARGGSPKRCAHLFGPNYLPINEIRKDEHDS